tara:strand:+ start:3492 stop:3692 length:201 start_codon:yes stop_codon:yes gene_type:complete
MVRFIRILKNYENICKIGKDIIKYKEFISGIPITNVEKRNQEILLKEFSDAIEKADREWERTDKLS